MSSGNLVIFRTWKAQLPRLFAFLISCVLSIYLSRQFPGSVITGELIKLGGSRVMLSLPLFWLIPLGVFFDLVYRIYNVRFELTSRFIEARTGILSLSQNITRIRYEDVRGAEIDQTILGRMLDYGDVQVGTAASAEMEVIISAISAPRELQEMILRERDRRVELEKAQTLKSLQSRRSAQNA